MKRTPPTVVAVAGLFVFWLGIMVGTDIGRDEIRAELMAKIVHLQNVMAQIGGEVYSERSSRHPHGKFIVGWNTTGTEIPDGVLVMSDTTGATSQPQIALGKGFKVWQSSTSKATVSRILGVTMGNVAGYSQGRILVLGFHPWVKVDATGITALTALRPSLLTATSGAMGAWALADTANSAKPVIGVFQRYANPDSLRGYVWVNTTGITGGAK